MRIKDRRRGAEGGQDGGRGGAREGRRVLELERLVEGDRDSKGGKKESRVADR